ncbi:hypothetical protein P8452_09667 [Trifolium repens]|nr:hypothetical protein P8452_09667 [Trifolium repens]
MQNISILLIDAQVFEQAAVKKPGGRSLNRKNQLLKGLRLGKGKRDGQAHNYLAYESEERLNVSQYAEGVRSGFKGAEIGCVASTVPILGAVQMIPWAKVNLNYTAQALIISSDRIQCSLLFDFQLKHVTTENMESRNQSDESSSSICDCEFWMF